MLAHFNNEKSVFNLTNKKRVIKCSLTKMKNCFLYCKFQKLLQHFCFFNGQSISLHLFTFLYTTGLPWISRQISIYYKV